MTHAITLVLKTGLYDPDAVLDAAFASLPNSRSCDLTDPDGLTGSDWDMILDEILVCEKVLVV